jgi:hypothetical protein
MRYGLILRHPPLLGIGGGNEATKGREGHAGTRPDRHGAEEPLGAMRIEKTSALRA